MDNSHRQTISMSAIVFDYHPYSHQRGWFAADLAVPIAMTTVKSGLLAS
jgi:hypothetical protein